MVEVLGIQRGHPQRFSEFVGQDDAINILREHAIGDSEGRAFLLHGPSASGKRSLARVFAKAVLCTDLGADSEPCCVCEPCLLAHRTELQGGPTGLHCVDLYPGRVGVHLHINAHLMPASVQRELGQGVDSPSKDDLWVLITTEPHRVPYSIRKRCVVVQTQLIGAGRMTAYLRGVITEAGVEMSDAEVAYAVAAGCGSISSALGALDSIAASKHDAKKRGGSLRSRLGALVRRTRSPEAVTAGL